MQKKLGIELFGIYGVDKNVVDKNFGKTPKLYHKLFSP